jgi:hypothetical protein
MIKYTIQKITHNIICKDDVVPFLKNLGYQNLNNDKEVIKIVKNELPLYLNKIITTKDYSTIIVPANHALECCGVFDLPTLVSRFGVKYISCLTELKNSSNSNAEIINSRIAEDLTKKISKKAYKNVDLESVDLDYNVITPTQTSLSDMLLSGKEVMIRSSTLDINSKDLEFIGNTKIIVVKKIAGNAKELYQTILNNPDSEGIIGEHIKKMKDMEIANFYPRAHKAIIDEKAQSIFDSINRFDCNFMSEVRKVGDFDQLVLLSDSTLINFLLYIILLHLI